MLQELNKTVTHPHIHSDHSEVQTEWEKLETNKEIEKKMKERKNEINRKKINRTKWKKYEEKDESKENEK